MKSEFKNFARRLPSDKYPIKVKMNKSIVYNTEVNIINNQPKKEE